MIEASTLNFLKSLSENNNREWFNANKTDYELARENVLQFTSKLISGLAKFDSTIPLDLNPKDCVMRIYRDIRFSKDKTPFKTNFGIAISQFCNCTFPNYCSFRSQRLNRVCQRCLYCLCANCYKSDEYCN